MGQDRPPAVRGLTGDDDRNANALELVIQDLREALHEARVQMEMADLKAASMRALAIERSQAMGTEYTADLVAFCEDVQRDARALRQDLHRRSLNIAQTATFSLDELRRIRRR